jgi:hypothetical protein
MLGLGPGFCKSSLRGGPEELEIGFGVALVGCVEGFLSAPS